MWGVGPKAFFQRWVNENRQVESSVLEEPIAATGLRFIASACIIAFTIRVERLGKIVQTPALSLEIREAIFVALSRASRDTLLIRHTDGVIQ